MSNNPFNSECLSNVSRETLDKLDLYAAMLRKWNKRINLISSSDIADLEKRHLLDSLQLMNYLETETHNIAYDLGSGGGLPAIPLSLTTQYQWHLVESDLRKCAFLRNVIAELSIKNASVINKRAEHITGKAALVTARALASLDKLFSYAYPLMDKNAICVFLKGENWSKELEEAASKWSFEEKTYPSETMSKSRIVIIKKLAPKTI